MKIKFILTYALIFVFTLNLIASDIIPGKPQNKPIALVGGTIHTITQGTIENGVVLFDKGKIIAVGKNVNIPKDAEIINISGKHVYPGLINAFTTVGLIEIGAVRATRDVTEVGLINPNVRAEVAFNPDSEHPVGVERCDHANFFHQSSIVGNCVVNLKFISPPIAKC